MHQNHVMLESAQHKNDLIMFKAIKNKLQISKEAAEYTDIATNLTSSKNIPKSFLIKTCQVFRNEKLCLALWRLLKQLFNKSVSLLIQITNINKARTNHLKYSFFPTAINILHITKYVTFQFQLLKLCNVGCLKKELTATWIWFLV